MLYHTDLFRRRFSAGHYDQGVPSALCPAGVLCSNSVVVSMGADGAGVLSCERLCLCVDVVRLQLLAQVQASSRHSAARQHVCRSVSRQHVGRDMVTTISSPCEA
mgnify:CR=1 FL=1